MAVVTYDDFVNFDYKSLFAKDDFYSYFTNPIVPFLSVALYLLFSNVVFSTIRDTFGLESKGPVIQGITKVHNLILMVYSGWTCYYSWAIAVPYMQTHGFWAAMCDVNNQLWDDNNLGWWITHFYISKYYEFIDTWIVLLKNKQPMFLQVYHHAGIVILMWGFVVTKATGGGLVLTCLNSGIHTIMYTYYLASSFGFNSPLKHYLTSAQLVQFVFGIFVTMFLHIKPGNTCINDAQRVVVISVQLYCVGLIYLFSLFYQENYVTKKDKKKEEIKSN